MASRILIHEETPCHRSQISLSSPLGAALAALVEPTRLEARCLNFVIHPAALTFSSYIFLTKRTGFAPGLLPTILGPLLGREGVAQNIPSGRDDFFESPVGNTHRDSQNVNLIRLLLESAVQ